MKKFALLCSLVWLSWFASFAQRAKIYEEKRSMLTYPFSQPDPVAEMGRIYPYFRFDGYTSQGAPRDWTMVVLENDYIKVFVAPEIGGKIWGAVEQATGKEFLYFNEVVKFRDIAMRGPWTSGGLEYNFGDIGHIPTTATPVDYLLKEHSNGSVSCIVGAIDLPSRTRWSVSINLHPQKAYVETVISWQNPTPLPVTYYHWMNAAAKASGNLEFIYPGTAYIGHNGEVGDFPTNQGRNIARYESNNFGGYKSYHVLNAYSNFFGGYWHDDDFGFGHLSAYDDKPGKKIWIWGLSEQGMIWEDLLTDNDGQYVEYQSGKLFNQAAEGSTLTPFKHQEFNAHDADFMVDLWFPLKGTGGMVAASAFAVLNATEQEKVQHFTLSALQPLNNTPLRIATPDQVLLDTLLTLAPLEMASFKVPLDTSQYIELVLGDRMLYYHSDPTITHLDRPLLPHPDFNWETAYGKFVRGLEAEKQRKYQEAMEWYAASLSLEPAFAPALNRSAMGLYRSMDYHQALDKVMQSLAIDTYDPEANYLYGLIQEQRKNFNAAKSGYGIAAQDPAFRVPAFTALAKIALLEQDYRECIRLAYEALTYNARNTAALEMLALVYRLRKQDNQARNVLGNLENVDPMSAFLAHERDLLEGTQNLQQLLTNELAAESYLELAIQYANLNQPNEAANILQYIPDHPIANVWLAYLLPEEELYYVERALTLDPYLIFPHRTETSHVLENLMKTYSHWKFNYYQALIYWNKGLLAEARKLLLACQNDPDFAPFHLAKAKLFADHPDMQLHALQQAIGLAPEDWRSNLAFAQRLFADGHFSEVIPIGKRFFQKSPAMALLYARSLILTGQPGEAVALLKNYTLLPFEGANEARSVYHEACIRTAMQYYLERDYKKAATFAEAALEWPKNLGVGKPYQTDNRMDYYILYKCMDKLGRKKAALDYQQLLIEHPSDNSAPLVFQALALRDRGESELADTLLELLNQQSDRPSDQLVLDLLKHIQ